MLKSIWFNFPPIYKPKKINSAPVIQLNIKYNFLYLNKLIYQNIRRVGPKQSLKIIGNAGKAFPGRQTFGRKQGALTMRNQED